MTNPTSAQALSLELQNAIQRLHGISIYELAELVHTERTTASAQDANSNPLVRLYEQYINAVASRPAVR